MADSKSIAIIRANALRALKETGPQIAAQLGIEPPKLDFFFKDHDYQQAQELAALAEWLKTLNEALHPEPSLATEGGDNDIPAKTSNPRSRR